MTRPDHGYHFDQSDTAGKSGPAPRASGGAHRRRTSSPGHGHGHSHGPAPPSSARMRALLTGLLMPFAIAAVAGMALLYPLGAQLPTSATAGGTPVDGDVTAVAESNCAPPGEVDVDTSMDGPRPGDDRCLIVDVELSAGPAAGTTITKSEPLAPASPRFTVGDPVVLEYHGADPAQSESYQIADFQRGIPLLLLAGAFALAVLLLSRWQGARALGGLALSFAVIGLFILPAVLTGENPLLVGIVGSGVIMFVTLYLSHGISVRTSVAVLGTLVSLSLIGIIAAIASAAGRLSGLDEPTTTLISALGYEIDTRGLLLAGVVIGALGVLDDVTVTQSSAVWELRRANPALSLWELYSAGLRIGRDHVAASVNTLVMAYAGAALPVMLYSAISGVGLGPIVGSQDIAQEIVRTLAGSIGIIAAVPVTTALATLVVSTEPAPTDAQS